MNPEWGRRLYQPAIKNAVNIRWNVEVVTLAKH